jgi:inhibitor of KinA sporulation pathway (predicted exonuclease)
VEATCDQPQRAAHEIIEWPVVLVDAATARPIAEFHRYVRPTEGPTLSAFCTKLTGIAQADVDGAQPLAVVLDEFDDWLRELGLLDPPAGAPRKRWALATDGPWDLNHFNARECARKGIAPRPHLRQYVNVRKAFARVHNMRSSRGVSLKAQLARLGLAFEGRPHCGRDDARNIARVLCALVQRRSRHALAINEASDAAVPGRYVSLKLDEAAAGTPGLGGVGFVRGPKKVRGKRNKARAAADEALLDARDANGAFVPAAA